MIWDECRADKTECEYATCIRCGQYPALNIICGICKDDFEGPFCRFHWMSHINIQFNKMIEKLDDEDWGSSPDLSPQSPLLGKCEMCKQDIYRIYILKWCKLELKVGYQCYDRHSTK